MLRDNKLYALGLEFDRDRVLNRYWQLAELAPEITKGIITGQLKALDALREELAEKAQQGPEDKQPPEIYRADWRLDA